MDARKSGQRRVPRRPARTGVASGEAGSSAAVPELVQRSERRQYRRIPLQLSLTRLRACDSSESLRTTDISTGGMYFVADKSAKTEVGQELTFELTVPPGEGYWPSAGKILGRGEVIRTSTVGKGKLGVAMRFLTPLSLDFSTPLCARGE